MSTIQPRQVEERNKTCAALDHECSHIGLLRYTSPKKPKKKQNNREAGKCWLLYVWCESDEGGPNQQKKEKSGGNRKTNQRRGEKPGHKSRKGENRTTNQRQGENWKTNQRNICNLDLLPRFPIQADVGQWRLHKSRHGTGRGRLGGTGRAGGNTKYRKSEKEGAFMERNDCSATATTVKRGTIKGKDEHEGRRTDGPQ